MMRHQSAYTAVCAAVLVLFGWICGVAPQSAAVETPPPIVYAAMTGLPFADGAPVKGVDVSSVIALEKSGVVFRNAQGAPQDLFETLRENGVNTVRIRIWNNPYHSQSGEPYGGGNCDVACATAIAKRCAKANLRVMLDFHYSDFWADPAKQQAPKAWRTLSNAEKATQIRSFTTETLRTIAATGAEIAMVQVGNETTNGMCGLLLADYQWNDTGWQLLADLWNAGASAVRAFDPKILVALHFTNPESGNYAYFAKMLAQCRVDYDVFASSYYPYWHGSLTNLTKVLNQVAQTYQKQVLVAETSWAYTTEDADGFANTISGKDDLGEDAHYPVSVEGQIACLRDVFQAVANVENGRGIGVCYWEPAWLSVGKDATHNHQLWSRDGSGWATDAAREYDADAKYAGGSAVDNQALFAADGTPLASLGVFRQIVGTGGQTGEQHGDNLLQNGGFEADGAWSATPKGWQLTATADGHFDVRAEDVRSGAYALHWYAERAFANSRAETFVQVPTAGDYACTMHLQGDVTTQYLLTVFVNEAVVQTVRGEGRGWNDWQIRTATVPAEKGDRIRLQLTISGGDGAYGSVDDCSVMLQSTPSSTETTHRTDVPQLHYGDVDENGVTDIGDVILLNRFLAEDSLVSVSPAGLRVADGNHDGRWTAEDAIILLQYLAKLIDAPTVL